LPRRFAPRWYFAALTVAGSVLFVVLGFWQWNRGVHREAAWDAFAKGAEAPIEVTADRLDALPLYTRVRLEGQWQHTQQVLLDNMSHEGRPGYEVLTPLKLADGSLLLVNRGWLPFTGYRDRLPDITLPESERVAVTGRLGVLPTAGLASGRQPPAADDPWPRLTTFPTHAELERSYGAPLLRPVLLLDPESPDGYLREWSPPGITPEKHFGYAVQWWMFAALAWILFVSLNLKRVK
jgi:surfeit locus 1 family protein